MNAPVESYPLTWPIDWERCQTPSFSRFDTTLAEARDGLLNELRLLGATDVVISSNAALLKNGLIASRQPYIEDTGVAVYFRLNGEQRCIPCDRWERVWENVQAIRKTIEALRGIDRWGTPGVVAAAFHGFQALPSGGDASWWRVLGVAPNASEVEIEQAYRRLAKVRHPDAGGSAEQFAELSDAYQHAKRKTA